MKEKDVEILNQIEPDENFFCCLDYAISHANTELLDLMLKKFSNNNEFKRIISNNLLANVIEKAPTSDFVRYVLNEYVSGFTYEDQQGKTYRFVLGDKNV